MEYLLAISGASMFVVVCWIITFFIDTDSDTVA
jgi:hypothetical protein